MNEIVAYGIEVLAGLIVIPWCVFVTASIFNLKQQTAVLKAELKTLDRIESILRRASIRGT